MSTEKIIQDGLNIAAKAMDIAEEMDPVILEWIVRRLEGGYDAKAELKAMFAGVDAEVNALSDAKFGPRT